MSRYVVTADQDKALRDERAVSYALYQEVLKARRVLKKVEWNGASLCGAETCPCCGNEKNGGGHDARCALRAALEGDE